MPNNESILTELREAYDHAVAEWEDVRKEGKKDVRYIADGPWTQEERDARKEAERPCLSLDELNQYTNQAINDVRQNKRAVKVIPQGSGATDQTAEYTAGMIRQIEYASNAQAAYIGAFESMIQRSYGAFKIIAEYDGPKSFNQKFSIVAIPNPDSWLVDPDAKKPDWSDMGYGFLLDSFTEKAFAKRFPDAEIKSFAGDAMQTAPAWIGINRVQVAEYWKREMKRRKLLLLDGGAELGPVEQYLDDLPKGTKLADSCCYIALPDGTRHKVPLLKWRNTEDPTVTQYITNGVEILETNPTKWDEVPIFPVFAKELWVDSGAGTKRRLISMVRMARDAYMLYCYYRTCQAEVAGMSPKAVYMGYEGQFNTKTPWDKINKMALPYAEVKALTTATGQTVLPLPQRQPFEPPIQALEMGAESARRAIQSAMGISGLLGTPGQQHDAKSGIALKELDAQTAQGNFHFVDNYDRTVERAGRLMERNLGWAYDTPRDVTVRNADDTHASVRIHEDTNDPQGQPMRFNPGETKNDVTISIGPSQQSQRDAADDFVDGLMGMENLPPKIMSLAVRLKNLGPIGDEISKAFDPDADAQEPLPPKVQAHIAELGAKLQQTEAFAKSLHEKIETKQPEIDSKERMQKAELDFKREELAAKTDIEVAKLGVEEAIERLRQDIAQIQHERGLEEQARAQASEQAAAAEQQKGEQAAAEQAQASDQAADAASQASAQAHAASEGQAGRDATAAEGQAARDAAAEQAPLPEAA